VAQFPLLAQPSQYRACDVDLLVDETARAYWLEAFESHFPTLLEAAASCGATVAAREHARDILFAELALLHETPDRHGTLDLLMLTRFCRAALDDAGIFDEFRLVKERENDAAFAELPAYLARLNDADPAQRIELIIRGMLAGNLFDMGVPERAGHYADQAPSLRDALARVPARPWYVDDLDQLTAALTDRAPGRAIIFADNAGGDAVLGVLPLARELMSRGAEVCIAANDTPVLNDVTADEMRRLIARAADLDGTFASPSLSVIASGNRWPLIDLNHISDDLAAAALGTDLLVLVGMGRAVESNWSAPFTCPVLRIAIVKDPQVARTVGASMYDAIVRFDE